MTRLYINYKINKLFILVAYKGLNSGFNAQKGIKHASRIY